jgi:hypothetical protein
VSKVAIVTEVNEIKPNALILPVLIVGHLLGNKLPLGGHLPKGLVSETVLVY